MKKTWLFFLMVVLAFSMTMIGCGGGDDDEGGGDGDVQEIVVDTTIEGGSAELGKGNIQGAELEKLTAAPAASVLKVYVTADELKDSGPKAGWGIGAIGNKQNGSDNLPINVPDGTANGTDVSFTVELSLADVLAQKGEDTWLFVNVWSNCKITKIELVSPK